jgi:hypothetical protein
MLLLVFYRSVQSPSSAILGPAMHPGCNGQSINHAIAEAFSSDSEKAICIDGLNRMVLSVS